MNKAIASHGYIVYAIEGKGHGLSDGLHGYINDFDTFVDDFFNVYCEKAKEHPGF